MIKEPNTKLLTSVVIVGVASLGQFSMSSFILKIILTFVIYKSNFMIFFITNFYEGRHGKLTENNYSKEYYRRQSFGIWLFDHHLKKMAEDRNDRAPAA